MMGSDPTMVTMRERVKVVKMDLDNPEQPPEIIEQEAIHKISLDEAVLFGFTPGQGFSSDADRQPPEEGMKVGDV
jgi:hypothetical protein